MHILGQMEFNSDLLSRQVVPRFMSLMHHVPANYRLSCLFAEVYFAVFVCVLAYMDQLLLRVVLLAAALPVAVRLVNGLGLLLTIVPVFILQVQGAAVMILWRNHWQTRH